MGGLGYGGNSAAMTRLAEGLPLRALERTLRGIEREGRRAALASALLAASGLVPQGGAAVLAKEDWKLFRVRPSNHPSRRLEGMAALLDRAWDAGLASWAAALVSGGSAAEVRAGLTVAAEGAKGALIGADRASDLAVNVVLPFRAGVGEPLGGRRRCRRRRWRCTGRGRRCRRTR